MNLSTVNPRLELDVDSFIPKDVVSSLPLETGLDCVVHFLTIMYNAGQQAVCACDVLHGTATATSLRTWGLELGVLLHLVSRHRCAECCDKCHHGPVTWRTSKCKSPGTSNFVYTRLFRIVLRSTSKCRSHYHHWHAKVKMWHLPWISDGELVGRGWSPKSSPDGIPRQYVIIGALIEGQFSFTDHQSRHEMING